MKQPLTKRAMCSAALRMADSMYLARTTCSSTQGHIVENDKGGNGHELSYLA